MTGIAIPKSELPESFQSKLQSRVYSRDGVEEYQFHFWQSPAILPVKWDEGIELMRWGVQKRTIGSPLPFGGWIEEDRIPGLFTSEAIQEAIIPARWGFHNGAWFEITQGVKGVVVMSEKGLVVYMLLTQATRYYRAMCQQSPLMPIFFGQAF